MLLEIMDPGDNSVRGVLSNRDAIDMNAFLAGGAINLFVDEHTSSSDAFDLQPPPSFNDAPMVWGVLDDSGTLTLFLATSTGDRSFPFASLDGFRAAIDGSGSQVGSGTLSRSNRLPTSVSWQVSP